MELKQTGYGVKIALAAIFAVLVVGYEVFVAIHLITAGHFPDFWSLETLASVISTLILIALTAVTWVNVRGLVVRRRLARALAAHDPSVVSGASPQPDPTLALPAGETLTLTHRYSPFAVFDSLVSSVYFANVIICGEIVIFQALPSLGRSALNPYFHSEFDGPVASPPTTLDWLAAALPVLLAVSLYGYWTWRAARDRLRRVVVNDAGVTVSNGLRRRRIAWNDIDTFARVAEGEYATPVGDYVLWGRSQSLNFPIAIMEEEFDPDYSFNRSWRTRYIFDGGYATYIRDAQRLLATIAARGRTSLLTVRPAIRQHPQRSDVRAITAALSLEAAQTLPLADATYAPAEDLPGVALEAGEQLSLQARSGPLAVAGDGYGDVSLLYLLISALLWAFTPPFSRWPLMLATGVIVVTLLTFYVALFVRQRRRRQTPEVSADETGLTTWGYYRDQPVMIPWQDIRVWAVMPPTKPSKPIRYAVYGDGLRLTWDEPPYGPYSWSTTVGIPYQSYKTRAIRLHALIAARTGLPLRELRRDVVSMSQSITDSPIR